MAKITKKVKITVPEGTTEVTLTIIADTAEPAGVDAFGKPAGEKFVPKSTAEMPKAPGKAMPAFLAGRAVTLKDGTKIAKHQVMPKYREGDGSVSDRYKKEFPHVVCSPA